uniref:RING-type domain-containing protein n=1 Tax=Aegilops tauschii subsp. strangulata TaxID=200361 RepID=A0A453L7G2_AEGTS
MYMLPGKEQTPKSCTCNRHLSRNRRRSKNAGETSKEPVNVAPKEPIFTCPVCWNKLDEPATTMCGHIFCTNCIKQAIQFQKKCPTCRKHLKMNNFHRIYLPNTSR